MDTAELERAAKEVDDWIKLKKIAVTHYCKCGGTLSVLAMQLQCSRCQNATRGKKKIRPFWTEKKSPIINPYRVILEERRKENKEE